MSVTGKCQPLKIFLFLEENQFRKRRYAEALRLSNVEYHAENEAKIHELHYK